MRSFLFLLFLGSMIAPAFAESPYAGQQDRSIKALSPQRIAGLDAGKGLGYAKAAELNGYPGPKHVLELAEELGLSDEQLARTRALFETMQERASALGREMIAAEAALNEAFAARDISSARLDELVAASARIEADLRRVHLQAHLDQTALLDDEQVAKYEQLRGYDDTPHEHRHRRGH